MSWQITNRVFEHSTHKGNELLLLLAIATHCDEHGSNAFPSLSTLGKKIRMSERTVIRLLKKLEQSGEITIIHRIGQTNFITINVGIEQIPLFENTDVRADKAVSAPPDKAVSAPGLTGLRQAKGPLKDPLRTPSKATRIQPDWSPPPDLEVKAKQRFPTMDISYETAQFKSNMIARARTSFDWVEDWKAWLRRSEYTYKQREQNRRSKKPLWKMTVDDIQLEYGCNPDTYPPEVMERLNEYFREMGVA